MLFAMGFTIGVLIGTILTLAFWVFTEYYSRDRSERKNPIHINTSKKRASIVQGNSIIDEIMDGTL